MAYSGLKNGEFLQYAEETEDRMELLEDDAITEVVLKPYSVKPKLLFFSDIDDGGYANSMAQYYKKQSITLAEEP